MKIKVKYFYPVWNTKEGETEIEIPDESLGLHYITPEDYIFAHEESILEKIADDNFDDIINLSSALDVDYAGIIVLKEK